MVAMYACYGSRVRDFRLFSLLLFTGETNSFTQKRMYSGRLGRKLKLQLASAAAASRRLRPLSTSPVALEKKVLAIRREESSVWERRAPLSPYHVHLLVKKQGVKVRVLFLLVSLIVQVCIVCVCDRCWSSPPTGGPSS